MKFYYGGQAVIEGVMIRGRSCVSLAVRLPDGQIFGEVQPLSPFYQSPLRTIPFLRGILMLIEALVLGVRFLNRSAQLYAQEEKASGTALWVGVIMGVVLGIGLFVVLPYLSSRPFDLYGAQAANLAEGILRVGIFVGYLKLMGLWGEIKRVFAYHGAEHKVINAYEEAGALEVEEVAEFSTAHLRCGTTLILLVMAIAIIVFSLLGRSPLWLAARLLLLPAIAALSYEIIRLTVKYGKIGRLILAPALWLQSLTTAQPDEGQIEVAIAALKGALSADQGFIQASEKSS